MSDADAIDLERLARTPSAAVHKQLIELPAGAIIAAPAWNDAIIFVTAGAIDVECSSGSEQRFSQGAALCFAHLRVRALHNRGREIARLLVIRRNTTG